MGEMAASIVHEINQPLAAVSANADAGLRWLARATPDLDEARSAFKRIVQESHRANDVIGEIRLMFKNEGQTQTPQDINKLIREVLVLVSGDIENQRVSVNTELAGDLPHVSADAVQLRQVFVNLITNAVDAMSGVADRQGCCRSNLEVADKSYVLIAIEDSGMGIDPNNVGRIFEPFFTTKSHGMGMGLAICRLDHRKPRRPLRWRRASRTDRFFRSICRSREFDYAAISAFLRPRDRRAAPADGWAWRLRSR